MLNRVLLYVFSFIIILLSIFNQINAQCDPRFDLKPIPGTGCTKYTRCHGTRIFTFNCPPKTLFDVDLGMCHDHDRVKCVEHNNSNLIFSKLFGIKRQTTTKKTNLKVSESTTTRRFIQPTTKKPNFFCPFGQFAHVPGSNCRKYYHCIGNVVIVKICPFYTRFDLALQRCTSYAHCPSEKSSAAILARNATIIVSIVIIVTIMILIFAL